MHIPNSTYRIQLNHRCTFAQVAELIPYFKQLGISDLYLSPILQAKAGSMHGYDTIDYANVNPELGGLEELKYLAKSAKENNICLCVDIVPNHMAASDENPYWHEVIEKRQASQFSDLFDIKWELSSEELVYRRFFDINELVCLHAEKDKVFQNTHKLIIQLIKEEVIDGLRIDHIDGLRDPLHYLKRLNSAIGKPFYIIAEKILGFEEPTPSNWPLAGTTGYDFLNQLNQLFINENGLTNLNKIYNTVTSNTKSIFQIRYDSLKQVILNLFAKEFDSLCLRLQQLLNSSDSEVNEMLLQCTALMPVYRLYNNAVMAHYNERIIEELFKQITIKNHQWVTQFKNLLLNKFPKDMDTEQKEQWSLWRSDWKYLPVLLWQKDLKILPVTITMLYAQ